jgi:hypothetical protein
MTMVRNSTRLAALVACLALGPAHAHHSYAQFDRCKSVALEGEITNVEWVNPHIVIDLKTKDVPAYRIEWFNLWQLGQAGIAAQTLKPGDHVIITGNAWRDPALKLLSLVSEISRPSDGWNWTRAPQSAPTGCTTG